MGRLKTLDERIAKKSKNKRKALCKVGYHQEDDNAPGFCVWCKVKKIDPD